MLTGSGVALILRVPSTPPGDHWSTHAWWVFAGVAAFSLATKYLIRYRGSHVFNPSNVGLVIVFIVFGSTRVEPLDFWWAPLGCRDAPGLRRHPGRRPPDHRPPRVSSPRRSRSGSRWPAGIGVLAASGHCMVARWAFAPVCGFDYWRVIITSPEVLIFLFFMITDPKTVPTSRRRPHRLRFPGRRGQHPADGAADDRVRHEGRAARRPRRRVRRPARSPIGSASTHARADELATGRAARSAGGWARCRPSCSGRAVPGAGRGASARAIVAAGCAGSRRVDHCRGRRARPGPPRRRPGHVPVDHRRQDVARLEPRDHRRRGTGDRADPRREPRAREPGAAAAPTRRSSQPSTTATGWTRCRRGWPERRGQRDDGRRPLPDRRRERHPARPVRQAGRPEPRPRVARHGDDGDLRRLREPATRAVGAVREDLRDAPGHRRPLAQRRRAASAPAPDRVRPSHPP